MISPKMEGLDGAHHLLDGVFFRDFFVDLPLATIASYPFEYYEQYPALGFIFWPPLFPFIEGLFFLVGGVDLRSAQILIVAYSAAGMCFSYYLLRAQIGVIFSVMAVVFLFGLPEFVKYQNVVMLELPAISMGLLSLVTYRNIYRKDVVWAPWLRYLLFSVIGAACLYTKQTMFFIFLAIGVDTLVNQRQLLKDWRAWLSIFLMVVLVLPLAIFTLKYGSANIAQSIGSDTSNIMSQYQGADRWSWEAWGFYPRVIWNQIPVVILCGSVLSVLFCVRGRPFAKENLIWIIWISLFYIFFSFFDNRNERFAVLVYPPIVFLFFSTIRMLYVELCERFKNKEKLFRTLSLVGLCASICISGMTSLRHNISGFSGIDEIISDLSIPELDGNLAYAGEFRQLFVYRFRQFDIDRKHYFLQADDILIRDEDWSEQLRKYRVRYLLIEKSRADMINIIEKIPYLIKAGEKVFYSPKLERRLVMFEYVGPLAATMTRPPLKSKLIQ
ncbi:MAG: glycosyltransferase family 39 protein [Pseudomonadales bacterium]|nr:glycosyltransferase family 39 protein [Pseudomonadales bacterium]